MKLFKHFTIGILFALVGTMNLQAEEKETIVQIETNQGKIKVKLYNDTPQHRDNFIKLVNEKFYDGLLFHRVIKHFMIQGGDPDSKDATADAELGEGDLGYTLPAEIVYPKYFHKRGMLAAARTPDDINPDKASSASQFYIVWGKIYTDMELDNMIEEGKFSGEFTPEQREAYKLEGGSPHLDGKYTIFGEVISGHRTVEKIQELDTNSSDRPMKDVKMKLKIVNK